TLPLVRTLRSRPPTPTPFPYTTLFRSPRFDAGHDPDLQPPRPLSGAVRRVLRAPSRRDAVQRSRRDAGSVLCLGEKRRKGADARSEEHTSELQSLAYLVCRLLLEKKKI